MKTVALHEVKDGLSRYLRRAESEEIVITRHGKAAGVLRGFSSEEDWFDYRMENDPRFLKRVERARRQLRAGQRASLEEIRRKAEQESERDAVNRAR
ncbi:MAG: type II toxin-antitoxin system prevent-host-death family antitoxin [Candidatus Aureabacteria bacterium]|nr:type II toxin-antitoxin system prevent-host-death family antitoxin [Candidatus Auribacterota bacterium]